MVDGSPYTTLSFAGNTRAATSGRGRQRSPAREPSLREGNNAWHCYMTKRIKHSAKLPGIVRSAFANVNEESHGEGGSLGQRNHTAME